MREGKLCATRALVLDYFQAQREFVEKDHVLFGWEKSMKVRKGKMRNTKTK